MYDAVILDADSMLFLCCYEEPFIRYAKRKKNLERRMTEVMRELDAETLICLIKGKGNFRIDMNVGYKDNRKAPTEEAEALRVRVKELADWAAEAIATPSDGGEADDYAGIVAYDMIEQGQRPIIAHIDKDLDQLYGYHYNFNKKEVYFVEPEDGYRMLMKQCLMGDKTDNIQGLPKYGPVKVSKLLDNAPVEQLWDIVTHEWRGCHGAEWKRYFSTCANLVYMRTKKEDLRELTFEELQERFTWNLDTGPCLQPQAHTSPQEPSDSSILSLID